MTRGKARGPYPEASLVRTPRGDHSRSPFGHVRAVGNEAEAVTA